MAWYTSGSVSVTKDSIDVTGAGTNFIQNVQSGDIFICLSDGVVYEIDAVVSATQLSIKRPYLGATATKAQYEIVPTSSYLKTLAGQVTDLIALYNTVPKGVADAQTAAATALGYRDSAKSSADAAASSAAQTKALHDDASVSAQQAAGSASAAAGSATSADGAKTTASTQASNAAASAQSASDYAAQAQKWATQASGTVDGSNYSARYYAAQAAASAASVSLPIPVGSGGTGGKNAADARANLGAAPNVSPEFNGTVKINRANGEGQVLIGQNDGYMFGNTGAWGWYSPTKGQVNYDFASRALAVNGSAVWHAGNLNPLDKGGGTMNGQLLLAEGSVGTPGLSFANDGAPDTGFWHIADGVFGITSNGTETMRFGTDVVALQRTLVSSATGTASNGVFRSTGDIGGVFADWATTTKRIPALQIDAPNAALAYAGMRWTRWGGRHVAAIEAYEGGSATSEPSIVLHVDGRQNAWAFGRNEITRGAGGTVFGTWNFDPNSKLNTTNPTVTGRLNVVGNNIYGEIGFRSADNTWQYLRGRGSAGGMEWVNNAYNAVVANTDDGGSFWMRDVYARGIVQATGTVNAGNGSSHLHEDGNVSGPLWNGYLSNWVNGQIGGVNGRVDGCVNQANADRAESIRRSTGNNMWIGWDGNGGGRFNFSIDNAGIRAYIQSNVSDRRLKNNVAVTSEDSLSKINALTFYQFDWKDTNQHQKLGIIAQQAQKVDPAFVYAAPDEDPLKQPLMYDRDALLFTALHAVQQLSEKVATLEATKSPTPA